MSTGKHMIFLSLFKREYMERNYRFTYIGIESSLDSTTIEQANLFPNELCILMELITTNYFNFFITNETQVNSAKQPRIRPININIGF